MTRQTYRAIGQPGESLDDAIQRGVLVRNLTPEQRAERDRRLSRSPGGRRTLALEARGEPAMITCADGVQYWNICDLSDDDVAPGLPPDHPARVGLRGLRPEDRAATQRAWRPLASVRRMAIGGQHRRAPRSAPTRRRGSRRAGASSRTPSADPPDDDADPAEPRRCGGCGEPLIGRAPQARYCDNACRMRATRRREAQDRARARAQAVSEDQVVALALELDRLAALAAVMEEAPRGAGSLARQGRTLTRVAAEVIA